MVEAIDALSGDFALRIYYLVGGIALIFASVYIAHDQAQQVSGVPSRLTFRGRPPTRRESIERRIDLIKGFRRGFALRLLGWTVAVILWGVAIPAAIFFGFASNYQWFVGSQSAFLELGCNQSTPVTPSDHQLALYTFAQVASALVVDSFSEALKLPKSPIIHNEHAAGIAAAAFGFKAYMQVYVANWVRTTGLGLYNLTLGAGGISEQLKEWEKKLAAT